MTDSRLLTGVGVSPGCAIGPAYVINWDWPDVPYRVVPEDRVEAEIQRLHSAVKSVSRHMAELRQRTADRAGPEEAGILDAQILMLEDASFLEEVERLIRGNQLSAERAFEFKALELRALWAQSESAMLRQRRADLFGISVRVLSTLMGNSIEIVLQRRGGHPVIVLTRNLTPGLTVEFDRDHVAGFASVEGTRTSHAAILAHSMGVPCVMGLVDGLDRVRPDSIVILDGTRGTVLVDPTPEEIEQAEAREEHRQVFELEISSTDTEPARTLDGVNISLRGNLDLPEELEEAIRHGAEGVGLLRTEFLVLGRAELPDEEEQVRYFSRVAKRFAGQPVVVRSYDLGGDKFPAAFKPPREVNPFLGWRAIRVCLDEPEIFKTQIRAMLRARLDGDIQLMLPLITQVEELEQSRELVEESKAELHAMGVPYEPHLPVGVMIETPAAAMLADELATRSDFLSVGTNDLTQYTLAVDRGHAGLARLFTPFHPSVVRFLDRIARAGDRAGRRVSVCGEMASDPMAALLLLGLGYDVFSVAPPRLPIVRWLVRQIDTSAVSDLTEMVLQVSTTKEVMEILRERVSSFVDLGMISAGQLPDTEAQASFKP